MGLFPTRGTDTSLPRHDRGFGTFDDYGFNLIPRNARVTITLADSDPHQDELRTLVESGDLTAETAVPPRTLEQERVDAPIEVRVFTGRRVSGVVGSVPRGLESIVDDTLRRLDDTGEKPRIPIRLVQKRGAWRVVLELGKLR